jgi:hypothetical protein
LDSGNQQVVFVYDFAQQECRITLSARALRSVFNGQASYVHKIHNRAKARVHPLHRPTALKPDEENAVIRLIEAGHVSGNFVIQRDVLNVGESEFGKCLTYGWIHNFLVRHAQRVCRAVVSPQKKPHLAVLQRFFERYVALIQEYIPSVPTDFFLISMNPDSATGRTANPSQS